MLSPLRSRIRMRFLIGGLALTTIGLSPAGRTQEIPSFARDVPRIRTGEPIFRFNGKNLTGFYSYLRGHKYDDPAKVFTVQNGMIRISGEEFGGLATKVEFHDYHLVVEWKWGERTFGSRKQAARDSGILLHCVGPDGAAGGMWMESQECQLIEGGCGDFIMVNGRNKPSLTCETRIGPPPAGSASASCAGPDDTRRPSARGASASAQRTQATAR